MTNVPQNQYLNNIIKQCVRCGQCRSICPVFQAIGTESATPRGKVFLAHLLSRGMARPSKETRKHLALCLLCGACAEDCPVGVDVPQIVMSARAQTSSTFVKCLTTVAGATLSNRRITLSNLSMAAKLTKLPIEKHADKGAAFKTNPPGIPNVGYFIGCATEAYFPQIARSAIKTLAAAGFAIITPPTPSCCGMPLLALGQKEKARQLNRRNLDFFTQNGVDIILTDCASCCSTLHNQVKAESESYRNIKVLDLNAFLLRHITRLNLSVKPGQTSGKVTYHDPCHHSRHLKLTSPPRDLLLRLPGLVYEEMKDASRCCGGSGAFMASNPDLSLSIARQKVEHIAETAAGTVITSCPSCRIQLRRALLQAGLDLAVMHPVELVAERL